MAGGDDTEQLAEVRSYDELITALRDRVSKLGVTCESIDDLAGMPQRYTNKLLSQRPVRMFGRRSLGPVEPGVARVRRSRRPLNSYPSWRKAHKIPCTQMHPYR